MATGAYNNIDMNKMKIVCYFYNMLSNQQMNTYYPGDCYGNIGYSNVQYINEQWADIMENTDGHSDAFYVPSTNRIHWYWESIKGKKCMLSIEVPLQEMARSLERTQSVDNIQLFRELKYKIKPTSSTKYKEGETSIYLDAHSWNGIGYYTMPRVISNIAENNINELFYKLGNNHLMYYFGFWK